MMDYEIDGKKTSTKREKLSKDKAYEAPYSDHANVLSMLEKAQGAEHDMREMAREAVLFVTKRDGQWEPFWWNNNANRPRYTFDITSPIVKQITGELSQSDFDIRVSPAGGDATKEVALTYDGLIRNIENISQAKTTYNQAAKGMVVSGIDGWRVKQAFCDDNSFDQDLIIEKINNFIDRVWFDPSAEKQDKSDARWCVVLHAMSREEYDYRWPEGSAQSVSDDREGEAYFDKAEVVLIGELLYIETEQRELVMMSNGQTHEVDEQFPMIVDDLALIGVTEVRRRKRPVKTVCSRFFDAMDWLDEKQRTVFNSIPIVPVYGNYQIFENKTLYSGAVEKMYDPQRVLNYSLSREIEEGALAPRAKWWMTMDQAAGHEDSLATLNTNNQPVQFYNPDPNAPGAPQQSGGALINPGLRTISESMRQIITATSGMFAANMGDNPALQSGVAIGKLQEKGDNGTIDYFRSMEVGIQRTGQIIVDAIPKTYENERVVRIMYEDGTYEMTGINQTVVDQATGQIVKVNDLSVGKYDVVCSAGPVFQNRQQETLAMMMDVAERDPSILQIGGDVFLNNINSPAAKQLAERKRAQMLAQGLIPEEQMTEEEKAKQAAKAAQQGQAQDPAMVLAQAEMLKGQADMLKAQNEQAKIMLQQQTLQLEQQKFQASAQIELAQAQAQVSKSATEQELTSAKIKTEDAKVAIEAEKLRIEEQRLMLDTDIAAAEFRIKEQAELMRLQQMQAGAQGVQTTRRARYNKRTGAIEELS